MRSRRVARGKYTHTHRPCTYDKRQDGGCLLQGVPCAMSESKQMPCEPQRSGVQMLPEMQRDWEYGSMNMCTQVGCKCGIVCTACMDDLGCLLAKTFLPACSDDKALCTCSNVEASVHLLHDLINCATSSPAMHMHVMFCKTIAVKYATPERKVRTSNPWQHVRFLPPHITPSHCEQAPTRNSGCTHRAASSYYCVLALT